jgi:hypothetical protein
MTPRRARIGRPVRFPVDCYLRRYLFAGSSCLKIQYVIDFIGGRTRTRTLDPLIKSQLAYIDKARLFSRLQRKVLVLDQYVTSNFPTFDVSTVVNIYSTSILMLQTRCQACGDRFIE